MKQISLHPEWTCPEDGGPLTEGAGAAVCPCGHAYSVRGGVYRFITGNTYADAFGIQWNTYRTTQLDSHTRTTITRDRMERCMGRQLWNALEGKTVLECGCGAGRFTEILLDRGALVTSIDLSSAVDANAQNCPPGARHRIAQADITHLPFAPAQYDVVFCLGVIQHTPTPKQTIAALWAQVKPRGALVIDHYGTLMFGYFKTAPLFRAVLRRMPAGKGLRWTTRLVNTFLPVHQLCGRSWLATKLVQRISPINSYYHVFPQLSQDLQRQWALLDTLDALTDRYKHRYSRNQVRHILEELGGAEIWCEYGGNGVEARATKAPQ